LIFSCPKQLTQRQDQLLGPLSLWINSVYSLKRIEEVCSKKRTDPNLTCVPSRIEKETRSSWKEEDDVDKEGS
jgi:hypothetical protein